MFKMWELRAPGGGELKGLMGCAELGLLPRGTELCPHGSQHLCAFAVTKKFSFDILSFVPSTK